MELNYLSDKVIKKALASENKDIRNYIGIIISNIAGIPYEELKDNLELIYPEKSTNKNIVNSLGDIVLLNDKKYFSIEVNYSKSKTYKTKNLIYTYQLTLRQVKDHTKYKEIKPITQININAFDSFKKGDLVYESEMMVKKYNIPYIEILSIYDINLSYFSNIDYNKIKADKLLKYLSVFVIKDEEELEKICKGEKELSMVKKELESLTDEFDKMFYCSPEDLEEQIREEYKEDAYKEVYEEALNQGRNEGIKENSIEIAKNLLKQDISISIIISATGLTKEEVLSLKE